MWDTVFRGLDLLERLVRDVAWPVVALVLIARLRPHLGTLLERLESFEFKGVKASLRAISELELAKSEVKKLPPPDGPTKDQKAMTVAFETFHKSDDVDAAVLAAWAPLEVALLQARERVGDRLEPHHRTGGKQRHPSHVVHTLRAKGFIDADLEQILQRLYLVRNTAVVRSTGFSFAQAQEYRALADDVIRRLQAIS